ncbi:MAG TPA: CARDB domain-containing protein [Armatimonadota bacterium]|nr:CARDB domain-containing protein [Armatimonadota bacterium]
MRVFCAIFTALLLAGLVLPTIALPDLDVAYISRTPRYDRYNVRYQYGIDPSDYWTGKPYLTAAEQQKQRWPKQGEVVTFTAVVKNPGNAPTGSFSYKWYFDGIEVKSGTLPSIAPGGQVTTTYSWVWDSEQNTHFIKFVADPANVIAEDIETNNSLEDPTNALTFRFHVWQSLYDWFRTNARNYAPHIASWDDWAQQQIYHMNRMFKEAVFPNAPNGILERVRLDEIVIVPDSTPDPGGTHAPDDWQWDGRWGFSNSYLGPPNFYEQHPEVLQTYEGSLMHELSHQIGCIDLYVLNIENGANKVTPDINHPNTREGGMMTGSYHRYSDHTAYALNSHLHKRRGFYGEYLYDVPQVCKVRVVDAYYRPLQNAVLAFYQDKNREFNSPPTFTLTTDNGGYATLPNRTCYGSITTATGHTLRENPWGLINVVGSNGVFLVKIETAGQTDYQFLEILPFNIAYWSGFTDSYTYDLQANIIPEGRTTTVNLNGIKLTSPDHGYAVGNGGTILDWNGQTWSPMASNVTSNLNAVDANSPTGVACAVGDSGTVLINSNGAWVKKSLGISVNMRACDVVTDSLIFVGGNSGYLYRSTDGGATWNRIYGVTGNIRSIRFSNPYNGILVGEGAIAYYTNNGGANWHSATGFGNNWLIDCSFPTPTEAWACNDNGGIIKSTDGGRNWVLAHSFGYPEPWYCIDMLPGGTGWTAGRYHSFYGTTPIKRFEQGQHYNQALVTHGTMDSLYDICALSENEAWVVGKGGALLRMIGQNTASFLQGPIFAANSLPDGTAVVIPSVVVTAVFPGEVFVEQSNRACGIRLLTSSNPPVNAVVRVTGVMATEDGERVIKFADISETGATQNIKPLGMAAVRLSGQQDFVGLSNSALLVKVAGTVTAYGTGWLTIDDGSGLTDANGNPGIKVRCDGITPPTSGFHIVTGISTTEVVNGIKYPVIRVRDTSDM